MTGLQKNLDPYSTHLIPFFQQVNEVLGDSLLIGAFLSYWLMSGVTICLIKAAHFLFRMHFFEGANIILHSSTLIRSCLAMIILTCVQLFFVIGASGCQAQYIHTSIALEFQFIIFLSRFLRPEIAARIGSPRMRLTSTQGILIACFAYSPPNILLAVTTLGYALLDLACTHRNADYAILTCRWGPIRPMDRHPWSYLLSWVLLTSATLIISAFVFARNYPLSFLILLGSISACLLTNFFYKHGTCILQEQGYVFNTLTCTEMTWSAMLLLIHLLVASILYNSIPIIISFELHYSFFIYLGLEIPCLLPKL